MTTLFPTLEPSVPSLLEQERRKLEQFIADVERAYPEGASLAEDAVERQRAVVANLERMAMRK